MYSAVVVITVTFVCARVRSVFFQPRRSVEFHSFASCFVMLCVRACVRACVRFCVCVCEHHLCTLCVLYVHCVHICACG